MRSLVNVGNYIQISDTVRLFIDEIETHIDEDGVSTLFMCTQYHENGTASAKMPYSASTMFEIAKKANFNIKSDINEC